MRIENRHPGQKAVILDYSRSGVRRRELARWVRTFWSHRARLELAQTASFKQALGVLAGISALAGVLSTTHVCVRSFITHAMGASSAMAVLRQEVAEYWPLAVGGALAFVPICFGVLVGVLAVLSQVWARLMRRREPWSATFAVLSVGCVPLLWFFVLLQLEGVSPIVGRAGVWYGMWNPVTNYVRFAVMMIGIVLLGVWIVDAGRMYFSMRDRMGAG
ncbi:MAG: hypothetical protein NTU53_05335 [Planctomycetota bacterium]|nr:hypothetical protein [Planctomycetota bacterium]